MAEQTNARASTTTAVSMRSARRTATSPTSRLTSCRCAAQQGIRGRSGMRKEELLDALSGRGQ